MLVTNLMSYDIYFGPLRLAANATNVTIDDTSDTSLYLTDDSVADALNNAYLASKISVSGEAQPFPRPTGEPQVLHGSGSPEGSVYAPQGSLFMRRDISSAAYAEYVKTTARTSSTGWLPLAGAAVPAGTSFPGSPSDGDEYVYVADATNGVFWRFRYYAASTYWAFVGGPPLYSEVTTLESMDGSVYADLATVGPSITLPFAATYDVEIGAMIDVSAGVVTDHGWMSYAIGASAASDSDGMYVYHSATATEVLTPASRRRRKAGLGAVTLTAKYRNDGQQTTGWLNRWMAVWPVKK